MNRASLVADAVRILGGKDPSPRTAAVIVAAGQSTRMGSTGSKNLLELKGIPVLAHTLLAFENAPCITEIVVVARLEDIGTVYDLKDQYGITKLTEVVRGGKTRALSVKRGFEKIHPKTTYVAIHDGARCLITPEQVVQVCRAAYRNRAATAACGVTDTVKIANRRGFIESTQDRDRVFLAQTPQVFHANLYRAALAWVEEHDTIDSLTDDNQIVERVGHPIKLVDLGRDNIKITRPDDLPLAEFILNKREECL